MSLSSRIRLQRMLASVIVPPGTLSSAVIRFARIRANFVHGIIPGQVYWSASWLVVAIASSLVGQVLALPAPVSADTPSLDLVVSPSVWTVTRSNSGSNSIALKSTGFSGSATLTVSGLPATILDRYPTSAEQQAGYGGYYCSSHCGSVDFPMTLALTDGQWVSIGPTLLTESTASQTTTVTITATANGLTISRSFTLKVINDAYVFPEGGGPPVPGDTANPDVVVMPNADAFAAHKYRLNLAAGQSTTTNVEVRNNSSNPQSVTLQSNLSGSGIASVSDTVSGGFASPSLSLAASETKTVPVTVATTSNTVNGTYEFWLGAAQTDGSSLATLNVNLAVTGGQSGTSPSSNPPSTTSSTSTETTVPSGPTTATATSTNTTQAPATSTPTTSRRDPSTITVETQKVSRAVTSDAKVHLAAAKPITIAVTPARSGVRTASVTVGGNESALASDDGGTTYRAVVTGPTSVGELASSVTVTYTDGTKELIAFVILVDPAGYVFERTAAGEQRLAGVTVTLEHKQSDRWVPWDATVYEQTNPQVTGPTGEFSFVVPPGSYRLRASAVGFDELVGDEFTVTDEVVHTSLELKRRATPATVAAPSGRLDQLRRQLVPFAAHPAVRATAAGVHTVAAVNVVSASVLPLAANLPALNPLAQLVAWLLSLGGLRKRRAAWGTVIDSESGQGVPLATVRLFDAERSKVVATSATDVSGRFAFLPPPGRYRLDVTIPHYRFPSVLRRAGYRGELISLRAGQSLALTIPVDPDLARVGRRLRTLTTLRQLTDRFRLPALTIGTPFAVGFAVVDSTPLPLAVAATYLLAWSIVAWQRFVHRATNGSVVDRMTKRGLEFAIVRLFHHESNKLAETTATDRTGRYQLLPPPGRYHASAACSDYQPQVSDPWSINRSTAVTRTFALTHLAGVATTTARPPDSDSR